MCNNSDTYNNSDTQLVFYVCYLKNIHSINLFCYLVGCILLTKHSESFELKDTLCLTCGYTCMVFFLTNQEPTVFPDLYLPLVSRIVL